ncbi:MAG: hypothetical protein IJK18_07410 [Clostridia bacterium]|nr:hypothetical protein [Clostridia bacterium]
MKTLKLVAKVIAIIIICLIGFVGFYLPWKKPLEMNNAIKDFTLSKDFTGYREIILEVSDANKVLDSNDKVVGDTDSYDDSSIESNSYKKSDEKVNSSESLNVDNYEKAKSIIEKRLQEFGVQDYNLSMDKQTGTIYMQIPENDITDRAVSNITEIGSVELKDSEDVSKVLLTSENFQKAQVLYSSTSTGTAVYLDLQFNKDGKKVLEDISQNEYKKVEEKEENSEDEKSESDSSEEEKTEDEKKEENSEEKDTDEEAKEKEEQKQVTLYISGNSITTTSFEETITDGKIGLRMGQVSLDPKTIQDTADSARTVAATLNNGVMPLKYNVEDNKYVQSEIKTSAVRNIIIVVSVVIGLLLIYMIIKFKAKGILATISYLGFVSLYLIILREFNVTITMEGILGGIIVLGLNYLANLKLIQINEDNKKYYQTYLDIIMKLIPIFAISKIFVFTNILALSSIGMVMFWGIALSLAYNVLVTKHL